MSHISKFLSTKDVMHIFSCLENICSKKLSEVLLKAKIAYIASNTTKSSSNPLLGRLELIIATFKPQLANTNYPFFNISKTERKLIDPTQINNSPIQLLSYFLNGEEEPTLGSLKFQTIKLFLRLTIDQTTKEYLDVIKPQTDQEASRLIEVMTTLCNQLSNTNWLEAKGPRPGH